MDILSVLKKGRENGIPLRDLPRESGLDKRTARRSIEEARKEHAILNMQDGRGYFIPTEDEIPLVKEWLNQQRKRVRSINNSCAGAEKWLGQHEDVINVRGYTKRKKVSPETDGQTRLEV